MHGAEKFSAVSCGAAAGAGRSSGCASTVGLAGLMMGRTRALPAVLPPATGGNSECSHCACGMDADSTAAASSSCRSKPCLCCSPVRLQQLSKTFSLPAFPQPSSAGTSCHCPVPRRGCCDAPSSQFIKPTSAHHPLCTAQVPSAPLWECVFSLLQAAPPREGFC